LLSPNASRIFENEHEIVLFKTLNLVRNSPEWVIPHIKRLRSHKKYTGASLDTVVRRLRKISDATQTSKLPLLEISLAGMKVCRKAQDEHKES
jgi:tRNA A-37 threonylcarbamoyl transferase component Bud32